MWYWEWTLAGESRSFYTMVGIVAKPLVIRWLLEATSKQAEPISSIWIVASTIARIAVRRTSSQAQILFRSCATSRNATDHTDLVQPHTRFP